MRNPLAWLMLALLVGGLTFVLWDQSAIPTDPIGSGQAEEEEEEKRAPADLATPEPEVSEPEEAPIEAETVPLDVEPESGVAREAIKSKAPISVTGRVVDRDTGQGIPACWASLVCGQRLEAWSAPFIVSELDESRPPGALLQIETDEEGRFQFKIAPDELESACSIFVTGAIGYHVENSPQPLSAASLLNGEEVLFEAKVWPPPVAGNISGWLRTENGGFPANAMPRTNHILIDIVSTALPAIERRADIERVEESDGSVIFKFVFKDVPEGEYNLTLSSLGNYRWAPTSMRVVPPRAGIEFMRYDLDEAPELVFEVFDAETEQPIEGFEARHIKQTNSDEHGVLLHTGPLEGEQFPLDQPFRWSVEADGYAVAYGDESAFEMRDGKRVARVVLSPGWSTRFLIMGGSKGTRPRPLPGVDVYLDDEFVGRSGPEGGLVVSMQEEPSTVEVRYLDWEPMQPISLMKRRSNVIPVVLAEPERE